MSAPLTEGDKEQNITYQTFSWSLCKHVSMQFAKALRGKQNPEKTATCDTYVDLWDLLAACSLFSMWGAFFGPRGSWSPCETTWKMTNLRCLLIFHLSNVMNTWKPRFSMVTWKILNHNITLEPWSTGRLQDLNTWKFDTPSSSLPKSWPTPTKTTTDFTTPKLVFFSTHNSATWIGSWGRTPQEANGGYKWGETGETNTINYPWTPKPWKMKVLNPQYMGYKL